MLKIIKGGMIVTDSAMFEADILIDGESKSEDQGQGYRSFLNSAVAMMLYDYFNRDDVYIKPGFLMIDTPLLGLDVLTSTNIPFFSSLHTFIKGLTPSEPR